MAPHFEIVDKDIEEVKEKREIENIKLKRTEYWRTVLKSGWMKDLEEEKNDFLDRTLLQFYTLRNWVVLAFMLLKN